MTSAENIYQYEHGSPELETNALFFDNPQLAQETGLYHGNVRVHRSDVAYTLEVPENMEVDGLAYVNPGFGGVKLTSDPLRHSLAEFGMATVSLTPGRNSHTRLSDMFHAQNLHAETLDAVSKDIGEKLFRIKQQVPNGNKIDPYHKIIIPHSMGGLSAIEHAEADAKNGYPQVDMIINLAAAGYSKMTVLGMAKSIARGAVPGMRHELITFAKQQNPEDAKKILSDVVVYYGGNPVRTAGEVLSIFRSNLRHRALTLRNQGTRVAYYSMQYDCLVRPDQSIEDFVDYYEEIKNTGHLAPQIKPQLLAGKIIDFVHNRHLDKPQSKFQAVA